MPVAIVTFMNSQVFSQPIIYHVIPFFAAKFTTPKCLVKFSAVFTKPVPNIFSAILTNPFCPNKCRIRLPVPFFKKISAVE